MCPSSFFFKVQFDDARFLLRLADTGSQQEPSTTPKIEHFECSISTETRALRYYCRG